MKRWQLIEDWRQVLRRAWSLRLVLLSALLSGMEFAIPMLPDSFADLIGRGRFAAAAFVVSMAAGVARVVAQPKLRK